MSFTPAMADSEGTFAVPTKAATPCRKCKGENVSENEWDSSCGGWTDYKYTCADCGYFWWVEGIDS
jgi:hypothetical protein